MLLPLCICTSRSMREVEVDLVICIFLVRMVAWHAPTTEHEADDEMLAR